MTDPSDWSQGCSTKFNMTCNDSEFLQLVHTDYYGYDLASFGKDMSLDDCRQACLSDCECKGFAYKHDGTGECYPKGTLFNGYHMPDYMTTMHIKVPSSSQITSIEQSINLNIPDPTMNCSKRNTVIPDQPTERLMKGMMKGKVITPPGHSFRKTGNGFPAIAAVHSSIPCLHGLVSNNAAPKEPEAQIEPKKQHQFIILKSCHNQPHCYHF
ncbi:hypothetical protein J5N97_002400 [Dioscorea zingiberensis]|uniref:Apple domain-containing protein n=1 Tax=Dioscorea zingiberensis TaxID=325984 RepID=A0A9D5D3N1_9LILI|nr:hypothetical protein J5N97_002400 [Dioscorea zingiberensis]